MTRRPVRGVVAVLAAATVVLTACAQKSTGSGGAASGSAGKSSSNGTLTIKPLEQIDIDGKKVEATSSGTPADPAGDGKAKCSGIKLGFAGALSGANAALGINIYDGAAVALKKHNDANKDCQVEMAKFDTEGTPEKATQVAPTIVSDATVIGLLGPAFSGETKAVGDQFHQAGLLSLTASATNPTLTTKGWNNFFRGLANDAVQGPAVAAYIKNTLKAKKVCVVEDDSDYGKGFAAEIKTGLGDLATCAQDVKTGQKDFSAIVTAVKSASPDVVMYAGYYAEAAPFAQQLKDGGVTAKFMSGDGTNDPAFVKGAGSASKGAYLSCPCGPAPDTFAKEYSSVNAGATPGTYSVEGYDLTTIMLKGIDAGNTTREKLVEYVKNYDGVGLARQYKWDSSGELAAKLIWIYQVG